MGTSRMVSSKRDLPFGDEVSWPKFGGLFQHDLHSCHCSVFPRLSVSPQIWDFLAVCWLNFYHDPVYIFSPAGNKAGSNRGDTFSMAGALVLEKILSPRRESSWNRCVVWRSYEIQA